MKRILSMILVVAMLAAMITVPTVTATAATPETGTIITPDESWYSSSATELYISDAADLLGLVAITHRGNNSSYSLTVGKTFYLTADIDLNPGWTVGDEPLTNMNIWKGIALFGGIFDGQGHTISGMYAPNGLSSGPIENEFGFVGRLIAGATIKNLNLTNGYLNGETYTNENDKGDTVGSFAGVISWGYAAHADGLQDKTVRIENCYSDLILVCNSTAGDAYAGGIYGGAWQQGAYAVNIEVTNTSFVGTVTNTKNVGNAGQIAGRAGRTSGSVVMNATYTDCYYSATGPMYVDLQGSTVTQTNSISIQKTDVDTATNTFAVRILSGLDSLNWDEVGFRVTVTKPDGTSVSKIYTTDTVFKSVQAAGATIEASKFGSGFEYLYGLVIENIPANKGETFVVTPFRTINGVRASATGASYKAYDNAAEVTETGWNNKIPSYSATASESYTIDSNSNIKEYSDATENSFNNYISTLKIAGFTTSQENTLGSNRFAFASNGVANVYVSYIHDTKVIRVYTEPAYARANPSDTEATGSTDDNDTITPKMWQLRVDNITSRENGGMSYVWLLSDGTFFIIDGGYNTATEAENLYNFLKSKNPLEGEPVISAWYFSHTHGDHIGAIQAFAPRYADKVDVKAFYYHFENNPPAGFGRATAYWPDAVHYSRIHTGQKINLPGISINVIYTLEDLYKTSFDFGKLNGNNHSAVIRVDVTAGGTTQKVMFLGDIQNIASNCMEKNYNGSSDALKSDIVQFSHHGYEGASRQVYDWIAAPTVLWPINLVSTQKDRGYIQNVFNVWGMATKESNHSETDPVTGASVSVKYPNQYMCSEASYCIQILLAGDELDADEITFPYTPSAYANGTGKNNRLPNVNALYDELLPILVPDDSIYDFG